MTDTDRLAAWIAEEDEIVETLTRQQLRGRAMTHPYTRELLGASLEAVAGDAA